MAADHPLPAGQSAVQPPRLSRYRTVRKAQLEQQMQQPQQSLPHNPVHSSSDASNMPHSPPAHPLPDTAAVGRSASRYRRTGRPLTAGQPPVPSLPNSNSSSSELPQSPQGSGQGSSGTTEIQINGYGHLYSGESASEEQGSNEQAYDVRVRNPRYRAHAPPAQPILLHRRRDVSNEAGRPMTSAYRSASREQQPNGSSSRESPPQDPIDLARPSEVECSEIPCAEEDIRGKGQAVINTQKYPSSSQHPTPVSPTPEADQSQMINNSPHHQSDKLYRVRGGSPQPPPRQPDVGKKTTTAPHAAAWPKPPIFSSSPPRHTKSIDHTAGAEPATIRPGGGGIVPQVDAPVSAANAGERRVMVTLRNTSMRFPVTLETTPLQLLRSASNCFAEEFDPRASFVTEVFGKANVQRPVRMYEHIRDVMNSWDDDDQHELIIQPSTIDANNELYESFAPKVCPPGASWEMHYSQSPGKWDKRLITLNQEGQLKFQKAEGKPATNICHLNDFDIYVPIPSRVKKIKPPKNYCFAVKSQQKSNMFMDTSSFIHFFATSDEAVASGFHRMVQDWRSWYLTNVLGEGKKGTTQRNQSIAATAGARNPSQSISHSKSASVDSHYVLGTFNDLGFDPANFVVSNLKERRDSAGSDSIPLGMQFPGALAMRDRDLHKQPANKKAHPPVAYNNRRHNDTSQASKARSSFEQPEDTFATTGLLGKEYAERQRQLQQNEDVSSGGIRRNASVRSTGSHRSLPRGSLDQGRGAAPKPLIDLTPQYAVPKQHQKKGKGFHPDALGPGGLIDNATTPDDPIAAPSSRDWRGANAISTDNGATTKGIARGVSVRDPHRAGVPFRPMTDAPPLPTQSAAPPSDEAGFATNSLLASMQKAGKEGWGAGDRGHGVRRGATIKVERGDKPMIDLNMQSQFAAGSLLSDIERRGVGNPEM